MGCCSSQSDEDPDKYILSIKHDHASGINCITASEDYSVLITGSDDKTIRIWSTNQEAKCIGVCIGHEDYINCLAMCETFIVSGSADKTLRIWDVTNCQEIAILREHTSLINRIIVYENFILSSSYDRSIKLWSFPDGRFIREFKGHTRGVYPMILISGDHKSQNNGNVAITRQSRSLLISGSSDCTAKLWLFETGRCLYTFKGHKGAITCLGTDSTGKYLVTGSTDFTMRSWSIGTGEALQVFEGHEGAIICMTVTFYF